MNSQTKRVFKIFWAWQDQEQEAWLQRMSAQGLHMKSVGLGFYHFEEGSPQQYTYRLDYQLGSQKDLSEYLELFEAAGWEYLGKFNGWQYFRKQEKEKEIMEIYTENESKIKKYERQLRYFALTTPGFLIIFLGKLERYPIWFAIILVSVISACLLYSGVNLVMILMRINQLKNN